MNVAVFGGSFDPPHIGHEAIIYKALKNLDIDKLIIVPTFLNPFKNNSSFNPITRLKLIKKLFCNNKKIQICDYEIKQNEAVPTIRTIKYLKNKEEKTKKIYLIIGADNIKNLHLWDNYSELKRLVTFVVATRNNIKIDNFKILNIDYDISSTRIRENLDITLIPNKIQQKVKKLWKIE